MRKSLVFILSIGMGLASVTADPATQPATPESEEVETQEVSDPALREELLQRREEDQAVRKKLVELMQQQKPGEPMGPEAVPVIMQMRAIDAQNRAWLQTVLEEKGWPGWSMVSEDGSAAAWMIVQHADDDVEFQERGLALLRAAVEAGDAAPKNLAYLIDRVRVNRGEPQVYGTQTKMVDGQVQALEMEDPDRVDERRAQVGLMPLEEYLVIVREQYGATTQSGAAQDSDDAKQ